MNENKIERLVRQNPNIDSFEITNRILLNIAKRKARDVGMDVSTYLRSHPFTQQDVARIQQDVEAAEQNLQKRATDARELGQVLYQNTPFETNASESRTPSEGLSDGDS